jgi:hypothetical protein
MLYASASSIVYGSSATTYLATIPPPIFDTYTGLPPMRSASEGMSMLNRPVNSLRLLSYFISLFSRISCHQKYFKTVNETTPKMHGLIL